MAMNWRAVTVGLVALGATAGALGARQAGAVAADEAGVRQAAELYLRGHATGRGEFMRQAFHPDAKLFTIREGEVFQLTLDEFVGRFTGKPPADEAKRKQRVASVDVTGTAAVAKIDLDYPDAHIVDYMSLLKVDGSWKIVNKAFHVDRKLRGSMRGRHGFWTVQLLGWGALCVSYIALAVPAMAGRPADAWAALVTYKVTKSAVGLILSLGLYRLYRGLLARGASSSSRGARSTSAFRTGASSRSRPSGRCGRRRTRPRRGCACCSTR